MVYPREYISYETVKKLHGKKILLIGPSRAINDVLITKLSNYDYIAVSCCI